MSRPLPEFLTATKCFRRVCGDGGLHPLGGVTAAFCSDTRFGTIVVCPDDVEFSSKDWEGLAITRILEEWGPVNLGRGRVLPQNTTAPVRIAAPRLSLDHWANTLVIEALIWIYAQSLMELPRPQPPPGEREIWVFGG